MKMAKTKKEIEEYISKRKDDYVGTYTRNKKEYIYFYDKKGKFTGYLPKTRTSINTVKKVIEPIKVKIKAKFKKQRGKKTLTYKVYKPKQRDQLLFRMNKKLRDKPSYKLLQKKRKLKDTRFRNDAIPISGKKTKIDLLFDKIKFEPVEIIRFEGKS